MTTHCKYFQYKHTLKMVTLVNFILYLFYWLKKNLKKNKYYICYLPMQLSGVIQLSLIGRVCVEVACATLC